MNKLIFITGGCGFIGSALIRHLLENTNHKIVNIDSLTYAGNEKSIPSIENNLQYILEKSDIIDYDEMHSLMCKYKPDYIMHLAAESHVDRSIHGPKKFIETNIIGTFSLLEAARNYHSKLKGKKKESFRFHHISTDEVYGELGAKGKFTEDSPYAPSSPYSSSKAASDHLVRAWNRTYSLPIVVSNCSNNYGPYQFPEKLIPLTIINALAGKPIPIYGDGKQVRDWLYVEDHAQALYEVVSKGEVGETYNIGGNSEKQNLEVIEIICEILEDLAPNNKYSKVSGGDGFASLIEFVNDRPGHDRRYAIDSRKIRTELGWVPSENFESGIFKTVKWYLANKEWCEEILIGDQKREG